jgi:curved DNA-binding protein CbpA
VNFYDVLDVPVWATADELRAAHRRAVRALHPDSRDAALPAAEADEALRLVNQAWEVLGDPSRRDAYDDALEIRGDRVDGEGWRDGPDGLHGRRGFPWWIVVLAVLLVIFVFTAYAGAPGGGVSSR